MIQGTGWRKSKHRHAGEGGGRRRRGDGEQSQTHWGREELEGEIGWGPGGVIDLQEPWSHSEWLWTAGCVGDRGMQWLGELEMNNHEPWYRCEFNKAKGQIPPWTVNNYRNREPAKGLTWCSRRWETHNIELIVPKLWMVTLDWEHREWITVNEWSRQAISNLHSKIIQSPGLWGFFKLQYKNSIISILCSVMVLHQKKLLRAAFD